MRLWAAVVLAGCFHPAPPAGVPCGASGECPGDQVCDDRLSPPTCVDTMAPTDAATDQAHDGDALPPGACVADADCASGVCHELTGACLAEADALFVAPGGSGNACTRAQPCGALQTAVAQRTTTRHAIALAAGTYAGSWDLTQLGAPDLLVSGPTRSPADVTVMGTLPNRVPLGVAAVFEGITLSGGPRGVDTRGTTTLSRVHITATTNDGIVSRDGELRVLDSVIEGSAESGIYASGGVLVVERSQLLGNQDYGIDAEDVGFTIKNTILASNGGLAAASGGAHLAPKAGSPAVFRFNTLARNAGTQTPSITCDDVVDIESTIVGDAPALLMPVISPTCHASYSLFAGQAVSGTNNVTGDPMFISGSNFHLQPGSPAIDRANPTNAEPIDIDGEPRATPDIGADELP